MAHTISNQDDVIDSREIIERIEELEEERDTFQESHDEFCDDEGDSGVEGATEALDALNAWNASDEAEELKLLLSVQEQAGRYSDDWEYGAALVNDSYFNAYMDEMLEDIGDIPKDLPCYLSITVDYDALQQDYTSIDFDGETYWIR
jgi:hypothetical protein